jgi:hypothetical protein
MGLALLAWWSGIPCIDFVAITVALNSESHLALVLVTATYGDFAASDMSVGREPIVFFPSAPRLG